MQHNEHFEVIDPYYQYFLKYEEQGKEQVAYTKSLMALVHVYTC